MQLKLVVSGKQHGLCKYCIRQRICPTHISRHLYILDIAILNAQTPNCTYTHIHLGLHAWFASAPVVLANKTLF